MPTARHLIVERETPGFYHCVSRCVRRAYLCGNDRVSSRSFEHRRQWIEDRLATLDRAFAVDVYAYAVMCNHVHVVLRVDPERTNAWTDGDVQARRARLYGTSEITACDTREWRCRLGDISWFMRLLKEPIARRANREDECKGRFWEGRFHSQPLLDDAAVLAAMAYVDLNPVRAGLAQRLRECAHSSIALRLRATNWSARRLGPVFGTAAASACIDMSVGEYIDLVDWTGRQLVPEKRGVLAGPATACPLEPGVDPLRWLLQFNAIGRGTAIGSPEALKSRAARSGLKLIRGVRTARRVRNGGND